MLKKKKKTMKRDFFKNKIQIKNNFLPFTYNSNDFKIAFGNEIFNASTIGVTSISQLIRSKYIGC